MSLTQSQPLFPPFSQNPTSPCRHTRTPSALLMLRPLSAFCLSPFSPASRFPLPGRDGQGRAVAHKLGVNPIPCSKGGMHRHDDRSPTRGPHLPVSGRRGGGPSGYQLSDGGGGVRQHRGALRLRQVHAAEPHRRAGTSHRREHPCRRGGGPRPHSQGWVHAPAGSALPLADHLGQRDPGPGHPPGQHTGGAVSGPGASGALRREVRHLQKSSVQGTALSLRRDPAGDRGGCVWLSGARPQSA